MNFVQPIRDPRKLEAIKQYLKDTNERDYILFVLGINTGLRISDILLLQIGQVKGSHIDITEQKTGKRKQIKINATLRKTLDAYIRSRPDKEYLFKGRSFKHKSRAINDPIDSSMAFKVLSQSSPQFYDQISQTFTLVG